MKVAITTDGKNVSKQFLAAKGIEIFEVEQGKASNKTIVATSGEGNYKDLSYILQNEGVDVLICGAIKDDEKKQLEECGIQVLSGARGNTAGILSAYVRNLRQRKGNGHTK